MVRKQQPESEEQTETQDIGPKPDNRNGKRLEDSVFNLLRAKGWPVRADQQLDAAGVDILVCGRRPGSKTLGRWRNVAIQITTLPNALPKMRKLLGKTGKTGWMGLYVEMAGDVTAEKTANAISRFMCSANNGRFGNRGTDAFLKVRPGTKSHSRALPLPERLAALEFSFNKDRRGGVAEALSRKKFKVIGDDGVVYFVPHQGTETSRLTKIRAICRRRNAKQADARHVRITFVPFSGDNDRMPLALDLRLDE